MSAGEALIGYLMAGAMVLLFMRLRAAARGHVDRRDVFSVCKASIRRLEPAPTWRDRLAEGIPMALGLLLFWVIWPLPALTNAVLVWKDKRARSRAEDSVISPWATRLDRPMNHQPANRGAGVAWGAAPLRCRPEDRGQRVHVADVEATAHIDDPLGRVPKLPFGHLHPAWQRTVDKLRQLEAAGATLWYFETPALDVFGNPYKDGKLLCGYAVMTVGIGGLEVRADFVFKTRMDGGTT